ncbi:MAG: type IV pilus secretin PilQ [Nitrospiraceae bacterium]|nr:type IV pilus secretin PilQ [Nitrospiraceae bacterium]
MKASHKGFIISLIVIFLAAAFAFNAQAAVIKSLEVKDNSVELDIEGPFTYTIYNTDPYRYVVELPGVNPGTFAGKVNAESHGISEISISQDKDSTRLEMLLETPSDVKPEYKGSKFALNILPSGSEPAKAAAAPAPADAAVSVKTADVQPATGTADAKPPQADTAAVQTGQKSASPAEEKPSEAVKPEAAKPETDQPENIQSAPMPKATEITSISFERKEGMVNLVIKGNGQIAPGVFSLPGRIVIDIPGVVLKARLPRSVMAPVKAVRSGTYPEKVRLVVDTKKGTAYDVFTKAGTLTLAIPSPAGAPAPATEAKAGKAPEKPVAETAQALTPEQRKTQKISLDFQNADIVPIFMLLGEVSGYNMVVSPGVAGTITLKLKDVPWEQALNILLQTFNLGKEVEGNVMTIAPLSQFAAWKQAKESLKETSEQTENLVQEVIKLNYATATDVSTAITNAKLLSPRGNITTDNRMNTLIIKDIPSSIAKIRDLVAIMDVAKPQVMIEAQIVEVNSQYTQNLGIRWGGTQNIAGSTTANQQKFDFSVNTPVASAGADVSGSSGAAVGAGTFTLGTANALSLKLSIEALETVSKARSLSNPRVLTMDNEQANIQQGTSIPVQTTTAEGTSTQYVNANLNLTVTPRITPDGYIQLKVNAANDSLGALSAQGYAINKKSVTTQAIVKDGDTLVLGGIYINSENTSETGIPLLSKIPILSWLFKTRQETGPNPSELLILVTPKIIKSNM